MSRIIELEEQVNNSSPQGVRTMIKSIFKSSAFYSHRMQQNGKQLIFFMKPSQSTFRLSTIWVFSLVTLNFRIEVSIYNQTQTDLLRAYTDRMKIQLSILVRMINQQVMPNFSFKVDHQSGALKLLYTCSWPDLYQMALNKERIHMVIVHLFSQLRRYNELVLFIEPMFNPKQFKLDQNPYQKINRFRYLLKNTKNTRHQIQSCIGDLLRYKNVNTDIYKAQLDQVKNLYMMNIMNFQKSQLGIEYINPYEVQSQQFASQLKEIKKNQLGISTTNRNVSIFSTQKITFGILRIQSDTGSKQRILSQEGAHALIFKKAFKYTIADTIYGGSVSKNFKEMQQRSKQMTGQLTYKNCNKQVQTSVNSFRNQLQALKYMKDMQSPFIARYYLLMKQSWNQKDTIYMNSYRQNLYNLLKNNKSPCIQTKLQLAYRIAKGLCFLYSKQIIHRDFKPQNVVVDSKLVPKIIDFGSCINHFGSQNFKVFDQRLLTTAGFHLQYNTQIPPGYQYLREKFTKKAYDQHPLFDIYGFGRTLCFIFFNTFIPPHPESIVTQPFYQVLQNVLFLVNMCLRVDPDDRPGFGQLTSFLGSLKEIIQKVISQSQDQNQ